jgi:hypothetical protein
VQPEAQLVQFAELEEPGWLYGTDRPQAMHTVSAVALTTVLYLPTGHGVHTDALGVFEKVPAGQERGVLLPAGQ